MKLDPQYDIVPMVIDPEGDVEKFGMPGLDGTAEYVFAVTTEVTEIDLSKLDSTLVRRMDNEVLRNLAAFAAANPEVDLSGVQLVDGAVIPFEPPDVASKILSFKASLEEKVALWDQVTRSHYSRGWYAIA